MQPDVGSKALAAEGRLESGVTLDPDWLVPSWSGPRVGAFMTTRRGGTSVPPYDSMNLGRSGGDDPAAVERNRVRLAAAAGAAPVWLRQVHGRCVVRVEAADAAPGAPVHEADAAVTTVPGIACTVLVADCLPVLFAAPDSRGVAAAHAGWRGLAAGVLEATVAELCAAAGCPPRDLQAWIGAGIGPERFQVGPDVLEAFGVDPTRADGSAFRPEQPGKWLADLPRLAHERLRAAGLAEVGGGDWCTAGDPSRFFSFRRERVTGRMAALAWIRR